MTSSSRVIRPELTRCSSVGYLNTFYGHHSGLGSDENTLDSPLSLTDLACERECGMSTSGDASPSIFSQTTLSCVCQKIKATDLLSTLNEMDLHARTEVRMAYRAIVRRIIRVSGWRVVIHHIPLASVASESPLFSGSLHQRDERERKKQEERTSAIMSICIPDNVIFTLFVCQTWVKLREGIKLELEIESVPTSLPRMSAEMLNKRWSGHEISWQHAHHLRNCLILVK